MSNARKKKHPKRYYFNALGQRIPNPWKTLGLPRGSSREAITAKYRERIRVDTPERAPEVFEQLSAAYRLLTHPDEVIARQFGEIKPFDLDALDLPTPPPKPTEPQAPSETLRSPPHTVFGEAYLYALLALLDDSTNT